ncbi:hypothetical protein EXIGLDRAFT_841524 [Exidia glandulosa HHB12029]|uniref:F-box domain-containing protein n=1 Tax=Exidia glandulosa HHB12029 TaxID=1314781 RepID=A0A165DUQ5_EXIGL|nr:hypothetical protein EXIGLDRAFT_841524 [Exidia glandulosa HHB12029]
MASKRRKTSAKTRTAPPQEECVLPVELLDMIFLELAEMYNYHTTELIYKDAIVYKFPNPLVACSAINRHWHAVTNRLLYRSVTITDYESLNLFRAATKNNKTLLPLVFRFTVDFQYKALPTREYAQRKEQHRRSRAADEVWEVMNMFTSLHHFGISAQSLWRRDIVPNTPPKWLIQLKSLTLRGHRDNYSCKLLSHYLTHAGPSLERLSLIGYDQGDLHPLFKCPPNLRSLSIYGRRDGGHGPLPMVQHIERSVLDCRLEDISLDRRSYPTIDSLQPLLDMLKRHAPTLRRLHLGLSIPQPIVHTFIESLAELLALATRLHTFSFSTWRMHTLEPRRTLLDALPPSLRTLKLQQQELVQFCNNPLEADKAFVNEFKLNDVYLEEVDLVLGRVKDGALKELRTFHSGSAQWSQRKDCNWNWPPRKASERKRRQLRASGVESGVDVRFSTSLPDRLPWAFAV